MSSHVLPLTLSNSAFLWWGEAEPTAIITSDNHIIRQAYTIAKVVVKRQFSDTFEATRAHLWDLRFLVDAAKNIIFISPLQWTTVINFGVVVNGKGEIAVHITGGVGDNWNIAVWGGAQNQHIAAEWNGGAGLTIAKETFSTHASRPITINLTVGVTRTLAAIQI